MTRIVRMLMAGWLSLAAAATCSAAEWTWNGSLGVRCSGGKCEVVAGAGTVYADDTILAEAKAEVTLKMKANIGPTRELISGSISINVTKKDRRDSPDSNSAASSSPDCETISLVREVLTAFGVADVYGGGVIDASGRSQPESRDATTLVDEANNTLAAMGLRDCISATLTSEGLLLVSNCDQCLDICYKWASSPYCSRYRIKPNGSIVIPIAGNGYLESVSECK